MVLTVDVFDQSALDALASVPTAAASWRPRSCTCSSAKTLDGVNLDFEGMGNTDQPG